MARQGVMHLSVYASTQLLYLVPSQSQNKDVSDLAGLATQCYKRSTSAVHWAFVSMKTNYTSKQKSSPVVWRKLEYMLRG